VNKIGIIGAMEEEVAALKSDMLEITVKHKAQMEFYNGLLREKKVVVVRSGIGKVNAAVCAQILIDDFQVDAILNTGIAGSLRSDINMADIVVSTDALQHDVDAREFGHPLGQIPRMDVLSFPADSKLIEQAIRSCKKVNPEINVFTGRIVTGDQFVADSNRKEEIVAHFDGYCTEMEGAAIAQVAYLNKIPFVIIRAISDQADGNAQMDFPLFMEQAIANSVRLVVDMIGGLGKWQSM